MFAITHATIHARLLSVSPARETHCPDDAIKRGFIMPSTIFEKELNGVAQQLVFLDNRLDCAKIVFQNNGGNTTLLSSEIENTRSEISAVLEVIKNITKTTRRPEIYVGIEESGNQLLFFKNQWDHLIDRFGLIPQKILHRYDEKLFSSISANFIRYGNRSRMAREAHAVLLESGNPPVIGPVRILDIKRKGELFPPHGRDNRCHYELWAILQMSI